MTAVKSFGRVVVAKKFSDSPATRYNPSGDFDRSIDRLPVKMTGNFFIGDFDPRDRGESEYTGEVGLRAILGLAEALRGITRSLFAPRK